MAVRIRFIYSRSDSRSGSIGWWSSAKSIVFTMMARLINHVNTFDCTILKKTEYNLFYLAL